MSNWHFDQIRDGLRWLLKREKNERKIERIQDMLQDLEAGVMEEEDKIAAAKMIGVRNPSFDGDMIGRLDDDFTYDDPDDEDRKR